MSDGSYRLIDLDATVAIGEFAGEKASTAYLPPEMTYADDHGLVKFKVAGSPDRCIATPAFDLWSVGVVMYRALARKPLFEADDADNLTSRREVRQ